MAKSFRKFAHAPHGRRLMTYSPGLRKALNPGLDVVAAYKPFNPQVELSALSPATR